MVARREGGWGVSEMSEGRNGSIWLWMVTDLW